MQERWASRFDHYDSKLQLKMLLIKDGCELVGILILVFEEGVKCCGA